MPAHIYAKLRSFDDWERAVSGDPGPWHYDDGCRLPVDATVFVQRASTSTWTSTGGWDGQPTTYPCLAVRELADAAPAAPDKTEEARPPRVPHRRRRRGHIKKSYFLPLETPEKLDFLCEAYRMGVSQVVARLIDEAYRRDVVESGLVAVLGEDFGIIAPKP